MKEKSNIWLAVALMLLLALTRWPGLLPSNFSAVYAMAFCTGLYFRGHHEWLLPLGTMVLSDVVLTFYYQKQSPDFDLFNVTTLLYMAGNYAGYIALFLLGRKLKAQSRFATLLGGGVLGAIVFYLVTNTAAWFLNRRGLARALQLGRPALLVRAAHLHRPPSLTSASPRSRRSVRCVAPQCRAHPRATAP